MAHLSAALQRLATLDDQLQQQRAALGARGRRRWAKVKVKIPGLLDSS